MTTATLSATTTTPTKVRTKIKIGRTKVRVKPSSRRTPSRSVTPPSAPSSTMPSSSSSAAAAALSMSMSLPASSCPINEDYKASSSSWRSTGWTPLAYPSSALFMYSHSHSQPKPKQYKNQDQKKVQGNSQIKYKEQQQQQQQQDQKHEDAVDVDKIIDLSMKMNNHWELNPYFPLHRDVILAATRELLILDGSVDRKSLEVIPVIPVANNNTTNSSATTTTGAAAATPTTVVTTTTTNTLPASPTASQHVIGSTVATAPTAEIKHDLHTNTSENNTKDKANTNTSTNKQRKHGKRKRNAMPLSSIENNNTLPAAATAAAAPVHITFVEHLHLLRHKKAFSKKAKIRTENGNKTGTEPEHVHVHVHMHEPTESENVNGDLINDIFHENKMNAQINDMEMNIQNQNQHQQLNPLQLIKKEHENNYDNMPLSAEDLANVILKQCVWNFVDTDQNENDNDNDNNANGDENDNDNSNVPTIIQLSNENSNNNVDTNDNKNNGKTQIQTNSRNTSVPTGNEDKGKELPLKLPQTMRRPRKVSDVDDLTLASTFVTFSSPFSSEVSPHLAVIALNKDNHCRNILDSVKRLGEVGVSVGVGGDDTNTNGNNDNIPCHQDAILVEQKDDLPRLLDISIMVESHLRKIAYEIVDRLTSNFDDKALRDFLGYKSSALKKDRILHLMSDFLFDVSHAMFAWDQTEADAFGTDACPNKNKPNATLSSALDDKSSTMRDKKVCGSLFDSRALRKIGGFDPSSLLYHAVSMKRLRGKGETWSDLAKSTLGKKMFRHHLDDQARVQVGQLRRGQRIRKSRSAFHPLLTTTNERLKTRSRSSSIASVESEHTNSKHVTDNCFVENNAAMELDNNSMQIQSVVPDLMSITVSRQDTSKSWGILLAKEGAMCVVMRATDVGLQDCAEPCQLAKLQKGDLIVSLRNEHNETVNTPSCGNAQSGQVISADWFSEAVGLFKRSCTLHLNVRRI